MIKTILYTAIICFSCILLNAQQTPFEKSDGKRSATYFEAIKWYKDLDRNSANIFVKEMGPTDAGYPLHLVMVSADGKFDPVAWHEQKKVVILVNNGIHPGEPDGIDASMLLVRDLVNGKIKLPSSVAIAFIPVYNIGGCLNRNTFTRINQNGPEEYGFRGNSQNLDLNRDFTKCDSKEARSFTEIFHFLDPDILIDNHVSDGADYQYTMTLITTLAQKMHSSYGSYLYAVFESILYNAMEKKKWEMTPYVNFETLNPGKGMEAFNDLPRFSSGYASLFNTMGFIPETHMLKPFNDRVIATYAFLQTMIEAAAENSTQIYTNRQAALNQYIKADSFSLKWTVDTSYYIKIKFKGYEQAHKTSASTNLEQMYYDHSKPFTKEIKYFNRFKAENIVSKPVAYIIPKGWHEVIDLLKLNRIHMQPFQQDTFINVTVYRIEDYRSFSKPFEKHHKNYDVKISSSNQSIQFFKGDYLVPMNQTGNRYLVEMLEPTGDDSFFAWNFFDAILQQKEGYSDYRWEDLAASVLKNDPALREKLETKKAGDPKFAADSPAILDFIYKNSPYYEKAHNRYPVYRIEN